MPAISASVPGKIILFGEHAVVYGRPAIAVPVEQVRAKAIITPGIHQPSGSVLIQAPNIKIEALLSELPAENPLAATVRSVFDTLKISHPPALVIRISSTIPIAAGLGSGAAVTVAIIRALSDYLGRRLSNEQVSNLSFEIEKLHHGTPSGIDNTVTTFQKPVYFQRISDHQVIIEIISFPKPFTILIADTGVPSPTSITVGDVRRAWIERSDYYEGIFDNIAEVVQNARKAIESGSIEKLGELMNANHQLLRELDLSSQQIENLVQASQHAGALGAKLSGGGRGGNVIVLASELQATELIEILKSAGATRVIPTQVR
ncbi:MAG: mevalonate kinase [Anaerolineales bacterium]